MSRRKGPSGSAERSSTGPGALLCFAQSAIARDGHSWCICRNLFVRQIRLRSVSLSGTQHLASTIPCQILEIIRIKMYGCQYNMHVSYINT